MAKKIDLAESRKQVMESLLAFEAYLKEQGPAQIFVPVGEQDDVIEGYAYGWYEGDYRLVYVLEDYGIPPSHWSGKSIHNMTAAQRMRVFAYARPIREKLFQQLGRDVSHNVSIAQTLQSQVKLWQEQDEAYRNALKKKGK